MSEAQSTLNFILGTIRENDGKKTFVINTITNDIPSAGALVTYGILSRQISNVLEEKSLIDLFAAQGDPAMLIVPNGSDFDQMLTTVDGEVILDKIPTSALTIAAQVSSDPDDVTKQRVAVNIFGAEKEKGPLDSFTESMMDAIHSHLEHETELASHAPLSVILLRAVKFTSHLMAEDTVISKSFFDKSGIENLSAEHIADITNASKKRGLKISEVLMSIPMTLPEGVSAEDAKTS